MAIQSIALKRLRPTQIAAGKRLVKDKRRGLRGFERKPQELVDFIIFRSFSLDAGSSVGADDPLACVKQLQLEIRWFSHC